MIRFIRLARDAILDFRARGHGASVRSFEVLELVYRGQRNKEIAASLDLSEETVRGHLKSIFTKLAVNDRTAAVNVALRRGILHVA